MSDSESEHDGRKRYNRSDDDDEEEDDDVVDDEEGGGGGGGGGGGRHDDDDIDEDEYDSEEYDSGNDRRRGKKRRERLGGFIIDEAEVDDEVEDDEEWEDGAQEIGIVGNEIDELGPTAREIEGRRRGTNHLWDVNREQELEEYLRKKYSDETVGSRHFGEGGEDMSDEITQQMLLPGVKDPMLWMLKCRMGEERSTLFLLMRKFLTFMDQENPLQIKSVVMPGGVKGCIYIEAYKQPHVIAAIENVSTLRSAVHQQKLVDIKEMTNVLHVVKNQVALRSKQWVRLKRGIYKGDIAQVDYFDEVQNQAHLKLLPRIDYTVMRGALRQSQADNMDAATSAAAAEKRKRKRRPPSKPFDPEAIRTIGGEVTSDGDFLIFEGNRYSRKGFLYKNFSLAAILVDGVKPTLPELERFEEQPEGIDLELSVERDDKSSAGAATHLFSTGDNVEVAEGELANLQGKILAIDGSIISIMPKHNDLRDPISFQARELRKVFATGDHVKVLGGRYEGDTGLIIQIEKNRAIVISDTSMHEMEILPKDLQLCTDRASGVDSYGKFQWGDLVNIDSETVGVIVRLEKEIFHVLSMAGNIVECRPGALQKRYISKQTAAFDSYRATIRRKDNVTVVDGVHSGRTGVVYHLFRNCAFLHSTEYLNNGGIFVCKTKHLKCSGASRSAMSAGDFAANNYSYMSPRIHSPMHSNDNKRTNLMQENGRMLPDREMRSKTIKIIQGPYKSQVGIVKEATSDLVRVELHSSSQTISVTRKNIAIISAPTNSGSISTYAKTPTHIGAQTPTYNFGNKTPLLDHGSRTPMHFGGTTPVHDGSRTPNVANDWDADLNSSGAGASLYSPANSNQSPHPMSGGDIGSMHTPSPMHGGGGGGGSTPYSQQSPLPSPMPHLMSGGQSPAGSSSSTYGGQSPLSTFSGAGYSPASSYNPQTPVNSASVAASAIEGLPPNTEWHTVDLEVKIRDNHSDQGLAGQTAVIRSVSGAMCTLFLPQEDRTVSLECDYLEPVTPKFHERVKVIVGEDRESVGELLSIDSAEGVVKIGLDFKLLPMSFLCKMYTPKT